MKLTIAVPEEHAAKLTALAKSMRTTPQPHRANRVRRAVAAREGAVARAERAEDAACAAAGEVVKVVIDIAPETHAAVRSHAIGVSPAQVVLRAVHEYLARHKEPVPAAPSASPALPATEARASARARPRGGMSLPRNPASMRSRT